MATVEKIPELHPIEPLVLPGEDYGSITDTVTDVILEKPHPIGWYGAFAVGAGLLGLFGLSVLWLFIFGTGIWGINMPVAWGFAIINFVWWIGIGHAGTLISAILLLLRQDWRNAINRFAEAMTIFAVACAGMFPILHMGRPWVGFFILPYPNTMSLWPNFRSPLAWDVFAISTYGSVSLLFWYIGLVPDFATLRDKAKNIWVARAYGLVSLGWRGASRHWHRYETAALLLAGLCTPLVVSVHSIVSTDFAVGITPGWHTTIFPPYFVAGAIYAGFAMVLTILLPVRRWYKLESVITKKHIDNMAIVMLATSYVVVYGYGMEAFFAWYTGNAYESFMMQNRWQGPYAPAYWMLIACNFVAMQAVWSKRFRRNEVLLWLLTLVVGVGMWLERYVIIPMSLTRDFLPSSWGTYHGTIWDWGLFLGTIGLFTFLMCLFIRFLPMLAIHEVRVTHHKATGEHH